MKPPYHRVLTIQGLPKSTNSGAGTAHWSVQKKEVDYWKWQVLAAVGDNKPAKPLSRASLSYIRLSATQPDFDNLVISFKHVQDALILAGILENDSQAHIGKPTYDWIKTKRGGGAIMIEIREIRE